MLYLAGEALVSRWAATLLHLKGLSIAAVVGHGDFHTDVRNTGGPHLSGVRSSDQDIIQVSQNHHQVLAGGRHTIGAMPVFLTNEKTRSKNRFNHRPL